MLDAGAVTPTDVVVAASMAIVVVSVVAERFWLHAREGRARLAALRTAATMGTGALVAGAAVTAADRWIWPVIGRLTPPPLEALTSSHVVVEVVVVFVAWDLAGFAHHWIGHQTRLGWASHQVHHTGAEYDLSLAWRQSWFPWPALVTFPFVAATGGSLSVAIGCAAVSNTWQALVHTAVPLRVPQWFAALVVTPTTHRRHHVDQAPVNLGAVLTCWDRLAGTWDPRAVPEGPLLERGPTGALAIELAGWRALGHPPPAPVICTQDRDPAGLWGLNPANNGG